MEINKASAALIAALCIGGGAGGAYFATRGSAPDAPVQQEALASADPSAVAVEQSEALVSEPLAEGPRAPATGRDVSRPAASPAAAVRPRQKTAVPSAPAVQAAPARREAPLAPPIIESKPLEAELTRAPEPPAPQFEELIVAADSVIGLQIDTALSSERARVEDEVVGRVTRDVRVGDRVAIPAGSRAQGEVTVVERGGKLKDRARLGVRFTSVVLADGTRVPLDTDAIYREGDAPSGESAAKIGGGAIGGAILGGILGGAKGAIIGGSAGAGAGTAAVMAGGRNPATFPAGTPVTVRVNRPAAVTVEK